jgi:hypothetical protein
VNRLIPFLSVLSGGNLGGKIERAQEAFTRALHAYGALSIKDAPMADLILQTIFELHLPYEIDMVRRTYRKLSSLPNIDPVPAEILLCRNALVESFCVHARSLLDFFSNHRGKNGDDAVASDFTNGYTLTFDPEKEPIKALRRKLNKQLFHLTKERTADVDKNKFDVSTDGLAALQKLEAAIERFKNCLKPDFRQLICTADPIELVTSIPFAGATGAFR